MTRILHLSDTHVSATGPDRDGVDAIAALDRMLDDADRVPGIDLVVVSGDVADDGSAEGCRIVRDKVGAFAAARRIQHVYACGNHDDRAAFARAFGSGHLAADGVDVGTLADQGQRTRAAVSHVGQLRVVTLDSLVPGRAHGVLDAAQLHWLEAVLAAPAAAGSVLVLHHPPLYPPHLTHLAGLILQNGDDLADVVRGRDVRAILAGHLHLHVSGVLAGVPVWVTPGVVTRVDATAPAGVLRAVLGAGATVVDLDPRGGATATTLFSRDPRAGTPVYEREVAPEGDR